jgi:RNA polymerase-binding transcription factor DksA
MGATAKKLTAAEFDRRAAAGRMGGRACAAARLVLVEGLSRYAAAERIGVDVAAVSRAAKRIGEIDICKCCGQSIPARRLKILS